MGYPQCSRSHGISSRSYVRSCYSNACSYACRFEFVGGDSLADDCDIRCGEELIVWFTLSAEEFVIVGMVSMEALTTLCTYLA